MIPPLLIIGVGTMGNAFAKTILSKSILAGEHLFLCDQNLEKLDFFEQQGCMCSVNASEFLPEANTILLAIKPQDAEENLQQWKPYFQKNQVIISMMAGVSVQKICQWTGVSKIMRIMPNTPIVENAGLMGYFFAEDFLEQEKKAYIQLLSRIATCVACQNEDGINAITALSGSGPGYYFYLMHAMQEQAKTWGFSEADAKTIALHTLLGAGKLAEKSEFSFSELQQKVTSKGGTTQAAIDFFEHHSLAALWKNGMQAAKKRAEELQTL